MASKTSSIVTPPPPATEIKDILNARGKLSIPYFMIRRRGARVIGDLNQRELSDLERFIENRKVPLLKRSMLLTLQNNFSDIKGAIAIRNRFKDLTGCTSKEIRESRSLHEPILDFKLGVTLTRTESISWGYRLAKLTSVKHKNILVSTCKT